MRRLGLLVACMAVLPPLLLTSTAWAHVSKTDGTVTVQLHVNPDDAPVSGGPTSYILAFQDAAKKFSLPECNCTAVFRQDGAVVSSGAISTQYPSTSSNIVTFPKSGVYTLDVAGTPKIAGAFTAFHVSYTIRVTPGVQSAIPVAQIATAAVIVVAGAFLVGLRYYKKT